MQRAVHGASTSRPAFAGLATIAASSCVSAEFEIGQTLPRDGVWRFYASTGAFEATAERLATYEPIDASEDHCIERFGRRGRISIGDNGRSVRLVDGLEGDLEPRSQIAERRYAECMAEREKSKHGNG